jgi:hypothetical protein
VVHRWGVVLDLSSEDQAKLIKISKKMGGDNAKALLNALARDKAFVDAVLSPLGQELLTDAVKEVETKIALILSEKDTPEDRAEVRALMSIVGRWQKRINIYDQNKEKMLKALT